MVEYKGASPGSALSLRVKLALGGAGGWRAGSLRSVRPPRFKNRKQGSYLKKKKWKEKHCKIQKIKNQTMINTRRTYRQGNWCPITKLTKTGCLNQNVCILIWVEEDFFQIFKCAFQSFEWWYRNNWASLIAQLVKYLPAIPGLIPGSGRSPGEGRGYPLQYSWASLVAQLVKNLPAMQETWVRSLGWEDPLEKGKSTHSSILAWRIPWTV